MFDVSQMLAAIKNPADWVRVIKSAIKDGVLTEDPMYKGNIFVYRTDMTPNQWNGFQSEGWTSQPIMDCANELASDTEQQKEFLNAIMSAGYTPLLKPVGYSNGARFAVKCDRTETGVPSVSFLSFCGFVKSDFHLICDQLEKEMDDRPLDEMFIDEKTFDHIAVTEIRDGGFTYQYEITNKVYIDADWLYERIIFTPTASIAAHTMKQRLVNWLIDNVPKDTYMALHKLIFIYDIDKDFDWLTEDQEMVDLLECHELPDDNLLGINWATDFCAVINIKSIINTVNEMVKSGEIDEDERRDEVCRGILTTVVHELRHLQQNLPIVADDDAEYGNDDEEDAENFARCIVDAHFRRIY